MKKSWAVALAVTLTAIAVALALVLTGLWPSPQAAPAQPVDGSLKVKAGQAVVFPSTDGSPEVRIPAEAISGEGVLHVKPVQLPDSRSGWAIELADGASLAGEATLVFKGVVKEGEPAPLVGFTESPGDDPQYITDAEVSGSDMIVRTTHFSNWFTDGWDWVTQWARNKLDSVYKGSGYGSQPECERESEARAGGVEVTSDSGGSVQWCVGKQADGSTVLKVNNSRGYAVSAEITPGLTLATRSLDFGQMVPRLAKYITAPTRKGNTIDIIGPGETVEYKVDPSVAVAVRLDPSPPAYLATALWFGIETTTMVYGKVFGKISSEAVGTAMDAANCAAGFQGMATTDVIVGAAAGKYFNDAVGTVMACSGRVFMNLAKGKMLDILAVSVAQVFTWVWSGVQTAAHGLAAAADTALNFNGYKIFITPPPALEHLPLPAAATYSGMAEDAKFSFQHPLEWKVSTSAGTTKVLDASGKEMATLNILSTWDATGISPPRPVKTFPATPGKKSLSSTDKFIVQNVAMDLTAYPEERSSLAGWPKPVKLVMSLNEPPATPTVTMPPFLMYGLGYVETGVSKFGETRRLVIFQAVRSFDTMDQATAYTGTTEYQQLQEMISSFKG